MDELSPEDQIKADAAFRAGEEMANTHRVIISALAAEHGEYSEDVWEGYYDAL